MLIYQSLSKFTLVLIILGSATQLYANQIGNEIGTVLISNKLDKNSYITRGKFLCSSNKQFKLTLQEDGNLCVTQAQGNNSERYIWCNMIRDYGQSPNTRLMLRNKGDLVISHNGIVKWSSNTEDTGADKAVLQDDGNFVVYAGTEPKWSARSGNSKRSEDWQAFDKNIDKKTMPTFSECK